MIAVKTDDAIYMNIDSFFIGDEFSSTGEGIYIECSDGSTFKAVDCDRKKAESLLDDIAKTISLYLVSSDIMVLVIHDGMISRL